jgi:hypothetical protein
VWVTCGDVVVCGEEPSPKSQMKLETVVVLGATIALNVKFEADPETDCEALIETLNGGCG